MDNPKDFLGNELHIGDRVAFIDKHYQSLRHGEILGLNEKQATIRDLERQGEHGGRFDDSMGYGKTCRYYSCIVLEAKSH